MVQDSVVSLSDMKAKYDPSKNITRNLLSRFEKAKIIGLRMEQLARGAPAQVEIENLTLREIALKELEEKKIPMIVARTLSNGTKEYWRIADLH